MCGDIRGDDVSCWAGPATGFIPNEMKFRFCQCASADGATLNAPPGAQWWRKSFKALRRPDYVSVAGFSM
jgi:hypothetical protein